MGPGPIVEKFWNTDGNQEQGEGEERSGECRIEWWNALEKAPEEKVRQRQLTL